MAKANTSTRRPNSGGSEIASPLRWRGSELESHRRHDWAIWGRDHNRSAAHRFLGLTAVLAIAALCAFGSAARAGVYTYANSAQARTINCGILLLDSAGQDGTANPDLPAPYPFYILEKRIDIKPNGWHIVNPLAPSVITNDLIRRYPSGNQAVPYTQGEPVTQNMAVYWQIDLKQVAKSYAEGADNLSQFNLLVIHTHGAIGLSRDEREALRQYVDQGGMLWVEDCGGASTLFADADASMSTPAGLFIDAFFNDNVGGAGYAAVPDNNHRHPITTIPYFLSQLDLNGLGDKDVTNYFVSSMSGVGNAPDPTDLISVVGNSGHSNKFGFQPYIAAGDYGAGHVVVDNADCIDDICNPVTLPSSYGGSAEYTADFCPSDVSAAYAQDLKFLVNLLSWSSDTAGSAGANTRRNGVEPAPLVGSGLVKAWSYPDSRVNTTASSDITLQSYGAAISGNIAYVTSEDSSAAGGLQRTLHAFDLIPQEDLNNDGATDDGDYLPGVAAAGQPADPATNTPYVGDWSHGLSYDELWTVNLSAAANNTAQLSPPTVASLPGGQYGNKGYFASVMVESDNGQVYIYDATCDPAVNNTTLNGAAANGFLQAVVPTTASSGTFSASGIRVPAPVYYRGWLIAAQPVTTDPTTGATTASVYLHNFYNGTDATVLLDPTAFNSPANTDSSPIVGQIAVASIPSTDPTYGGEDIVCCVSTENNIYTLFLGSRDERLAPSFKTKLSAMAGELKDSAGQPPSIFGAPEDQFQVNASDSKELAFVYMNPNPIWDGSTLGSPQFRDAGIDATNNISINTFSPSETTAYGDYDVLVPSTGGPYVLSRHQIQASPGSPAEVAAFVQGVAIGPDNVLYATVDEGSATASSASYIEAISDQDPGLAGPGTVIKWRFALANAGPDADGVSYAFGGYRFVGAPVVDGNYVYAIATNGLISDVLCFNRNPIVTVPVGGSINTGSTGTFTGFTAVTQTDENGDQQTLQPSQYFVSDNTNVTIQIKNFSGSGTGGMQIVPNVCVPLPITATYETSSDNGSGGAVTGLFQISTSGAGSPLLNWWFQTPNAAQSPSPITEIGNSICFACGDPTGTGANTIEEIHLGIAGAAGLIGSTRQIVLTPASLGNVYSTAVLACGQLNAGLVASGAYVLATGTALPNSSGPGAISGGIEGAVYGLTMIADNNRLIEIDPAGNAVWSLDSTSEQMTVGGQLPSEGNPATGATPAATVVSLSRPSSISELTGNDILFADSGNSRCVRVDRSGNVLWELTAFQDPSGLLAPGQPLTLNHPSSVVEWREDYIGTNGTNQVDWVIEHYLVADTGNFRVLEVDDLYTEDINGVLNPVPAYFHVLHWATHTFDALGRQYRYVAAAPYVDGNGNAGIVAAISNKQIAPLILGTDSSGSTPVLDAASKDTAGSTIMVFDSSAGADRYTPTPNLNMSAAPMYTVNVPAYSSTNAWPYAYAYNGLPDRLVTQVRYIPTVGATPILLPLRNLRSISVYRPVGGSYDNIMIADDDGVFDGPFADMVAGADYNGYIDTTAGGFSYTAVDYQTMIDSVSTSNGAAYPDTVFIPSSAQHLDNGDYLITNGAAVGDARPWDATAGANNSAQSGGCVFEISATKNLLSFLFGRRIPTAAVAGASVPTGPTNSAPLSQPAFAYRSQ